MKQKLKRFASLAAWALVPVRLFAQDLMPSGMTSLAESILEIFTGNFVKAILAIFLCGAAIAYGFNKDNEKVKRNAIAIGIAAAILISASAIVNAVWDASGG
ncbi:MAG: TrbC/VirB2 family protein [Treponema sp.]|jgi:type IV secretory pathway VirB2 component (pilin)|nr:TrbC/VirB2 family protein [Treponema sp.]